MTLFLNTTVLAQKETQVVHIAKLVIDSTQLQEYKAALKLHAETAVLKEPGVITLYAVYEKNRPTNVTVFEVYKNIDAYKAHLRSAHFLKYKRDTKEMVKFLELVEAVPIALESKK